MALTIKDNGKYAVMVESSAGTYEAPAGAGDFVGVLKDGAELNPAKDLLERNIFTGSIGKVAPRTGTRTVSGALSVELKAGSTAGADPEYSQLIKGALGGSRNRATAVTTKASGNTATVLQIEDADIADLQVGDIIVVKQAGAYHVSPITARSTGTGTATVTLLVAHPSGDCADSVEIAPFRTWYAANTGHPNLSVTKYVDDVITETAYGTRCTSMALEGFSTGGLTSLSFGFEGVGYSRTVAAPGYTPSYDTSLPPVILNASVFVDGVEVDVNEVTFSLENVVGWATSTGSSNGRISGRVAERDITGTMNPYKQSDSVAFFTKFDLNTQFSLFFYAYNPTVTGEFNEVVAFYLPANVLTELAEADQDGVLQDALTFKASTGTGTGSELYFSMS